MKSRKLISHSKIGILILTLLVAVDGCSPRVSPPPDSLVRFENLAFTINPAELADTINMHYPALVPFFRIFNEEVIRIGPDSLPGFSSQLARFTSDALIRKAFTEIDSASESYNAAYRKIDEALTRWADIPGNKRPEYLVSFISGFNQSFVTLPGCLGIGVDNYLGAENPIYQGMAIPVYIRKSMNPNNLPADAVRAWLYSELPVSQDDGGFLDRMIYEGKVYYLTNKLISGLKEEDLFHYSGTQLKWCREHEEAMWKYLAEQKILFSTDHMTIRQFMDEAPFTRDFGNDSPGKVGVWIGYQVVSSFMKATGTKMEDLIQITHAREILSGSRYHP